VDALAASVVQSLDAANVVSSIGSAADQLADRLHVLLARADTVGNRAALQALRVPGCSGTETLADLTARAEALRNADQATLIDRIVQGTIPLAACVEQLVDLVVVTDPTQTSAAQIAKLAAHRLVAPTGLSELTAIARRVEAFAAMAVTVQTLDVPIGGDILERYTQAGVVTVILPQKQFGLVQTFAAFSLYAFSDWKTNPHLTAPVQPKNWTTDRFALQFGYPVGSAWQESASRLIRSTSLVCCIA
jgi:hypothetical protein